MRKYVVCILLAIYLIALLEIKIGNPIVYKSQEPIVQKEKQKVQITSGETIGILKIKKINLSINILEDASEENLKIASAHIKETHFFWEDGNCFISAHRSWTYGKMFNRLNELKIDDFIAVESARGNFNYKVYKIKIVKPENTDIFYEESAKDCLALTTCTPIYKATHRLIVFALKL